MLKYKDFLSLDSNISQNEKVEFEVSFVERILPYSVCQKNINELSSRDTSRNNVLTQIGIDKDYKKTLIILLIVTKKEQFHIS